MVILSSVTKQSIVLEMSNREKEWTRMYGFMNGLYSLGKKKNCRIDKPPAKRQYSKSSICKKSFDYSTCNMVAPLLSVVNADVCYDEAVAPLSTMNSRDLQSWWIECY